jgi:hypothetical protein
LSTDLRKHIPGLGEATPFEGLGTVNAMMRKLSEK